MPDSGPPNAFPAVNIDDEPFRIVFVCFGNACRSQMAEGFAQHQAPPWLEVSSAGLIPLGYIPEPVVDVMAEQGIDVGEQPSTGLEAVGWESVSLLVDMVGIPDGHIAYAGPQIVWEIDDPFDEPMGEYRRVRDLISERVDELIESLRRERR